MSSKRDQIHGEIFFSDAEMKIINSRSFERLRHIKQLGFVEYIFPGASHNRYQHSLGVCQCVTEMYNTVVKNCPSFYREGDLELLRMMALIHDLGHSPFSHASEELSPLTHEERLEDILDIERKNIIVPNDYGIDTCDLLYQVYLGEGVTYLKDSHLITLHSFLDGFIDADKLDYLERDALNCGVKYGVLDRQALINNLTISMDKNRMEILALKKEGVQALESFILARYYMFNQVYTHPIERLYRLQFCEEMKELLPNGKYPDDTKKFLTLDDTKYVRKLRFLKNDNYELIFDSEYDNDLKLKVNRKLGNLVLCDTVRKRIFRNDSEDSTVYIVDDLYDRVVPCSKVSPILEGVEYASIHKLRYYAEKSVAKEVKSELLKIAKGIN